MSACVHSACACAFVFARDKNIGIHTFRLRADSVRLPLGSVDTVHTMGGTTVSSTVTRAVSSTITVGRVRDGRSVGGNVTIMTDMIGVAVVLNGAATMVRRSDGKMSGRIGTTDGRHMMCRRGVVGGGHSAGVMRSGDHLGHGMHGLHGMVDGGHMMDGRRNDGGSRVHDGRMVDGGRGLVDDGIEAVHIIGGIVDGTDGTVGLDERVLTLDDVAVAHLMLGLNVAGVTVMDAIVERVFRVRLKGDSKIFLFRLDPC